MTEAGHACCRSFSLVEWWPFCPVNPLNFLLHFYAIGVWIRSENRWVSFCPAFYKSQYFQASAAFITEAEILMKPARIRRNGRLPYASCSNGKMLFT